MSADYVSQPASLGPSIRTALGVGVLYFIVASVTIGATSDGRNHAAVWLADAIILAALLALPRRRWFLVLLAGVIANQFANDAMRGFNLAHLAYGLANIGQVLLAAILIRVHPMSSPLGNLGSLGRFLLWAGVVSPAIGAALGSVVSWWIYDQDYPTSFVRWFASNSLGLIVGTPLLKAWFDGTLKESWQMRTVMQRGNMAAGLMVFAVVVQVTFSLRDLPLLFLPVSALVILAIGLGRTGVMFAVLIAAVFATAETSDNFGPLSLLAVDDFRKATFFQIYLGCLLATGMLVVTIVTARSDAMARLADREQMLRQVLLHGQDVVASFDAQSRCTFCAGPTSSLLGIPNDEILGHTTLELAQRIAMPLAMLDAQQCVMRPAPLTLEFQLPGSGAWIEGTLTPIVVEECLSSSVVTLRNITSQREQKDDLHRRAFIDELTQVLNRAGFNRQIEEALRLRAPVTLALIDLDSFKTINDTYGHTSGDEVLVVVSEIISAHVRESDAVARIGGDEFAVLFGGGPDAALAACQRICNCVGETKILASDRRHMSVTISCGIATLPPDGDRRALFEAADAALFQVKHCGRNGARLAA